MIYQKKILYKHILSKLSYIYIHMLLYIHNVVILYIKYNIIYGKHEIKCVLNIICNVYIYICYITYINYFTYVFHILFTL